MDEAEASFIQALEINPSFVKGYYNLGNMLRGVGRLDEAESTYKKAIALKPDYAEAHSDLGRALQDLGRSDEAASSYRQALLSNPDDAQAVHMLSALTGVNTKRAPLDYVEDLFDGYAERFDSSLVDQLDYRTPKAIAELIARNNQTDNLGSVLDLGCGTGLFGIEIAQVCDRIEGLDVSRKTLLKAQARGIYDKLVKQDLESYLLNEALDFNYFFATDVFVYIGDLVDVFRSIQSRNRSGGTLVFSVDHKDGSGFSLLPSGRYAHSKSYIEEICNKFNYQLEYFETQDLRLEAGSYIRGGLYLLSF